ncbi:hypothetical protein B0H16DRAFT_1498965 [Mycena metata]|uniref:Uncharacterized protein n=1 Tax=Mycena metata TaxID=1033252 RepID=A0AAD7KA92_9AGAR|nr:hypothetical protein B0H16DRAFT_1498965 [Mycena metata]
MPSRMSAESTGMSPTFTPSAEESALVATLFSRGEPHKLGVLTGQVALDLFSKTNLSDQVLGEIWGIADKDGHGWLSPKQAAVAVRLIGWAQVGVKATPELLQKPGPLAHIPDVPAAGPSKIASPPAPAFPSKMPAAQTSEIPPFTPGDRAKFHRLFANSGPVDGLVDGDRAREIFSKSKLPDEKLSQIWELSDTENRGALDCKGFTIALHLIQGLMNNRFATLPACLPDELYEQAMSPDPPSSPAPPSPSSRATSSNGHLSVRTDLPGSSNGSPASSRHSKSPSLGGQGDWEIPASIKAVADRQFDALDPLKNGFIHDNISLPFLLESKLPADELARIWTLADLNGDGKLTRDGFAIALYLIEERRRSNVPAPPPLASHPTGPASQFPPAKVATAPLAPMATGNLQPRPSFVPYPTLPAQSNTVRFSSLWTPTTELGFLAPPAPPSPSDPAITHLTRQVAEMQKLIVQLRQSHVEKATALANLTSENVSLRVVIEELQSQAATEDPASQNEVNKVLVKENEGLRASMREMKETLEQLQASSTDVEMQRIQYEDLVRENERLHGQVDEMRESTTQLPWSGGDSELQTLINEDLAHENARLRTEAREMQENVAQLQEATSDYAEQRRVNAQLKADAERLEALVQTMGKSMDRQKREMRQLLNEMERLKMQAQTQTQGRAGRSNGAAGPSRRTDSTDVPPPAYNELDASVVLP